MKKSNYLWLAEEPWITSDLMTHEEHSWTNSELLPLWTSVANSFQDNPAKTGQKYSAGEEKNWAFL
jgi:hypothetical protein